MPSSPIWTSCETRAPDQHAAFRATFTLEQPATLTLRSIGAGAYALYIDGTYLHDGPARFALDHPEWLQAPLRMEAGDHVIAVHATHTGVATRMLPEMPAFFRLELIDEHGEALPLRWRCLRLAGYKPGVRRICRQLGWVEWCDTRKLPEGWREPGFDDRDWSPPVDVPGPVGELPVARLGRIGTFTHAGRCIAAGNLTEIFGYPEDDVATRFFLRELDPADCPSTGVWRRYDLGRVRLMRPRFVIDAPAGATIEFACCEQLLHDRVSPWIGWSLGLSGNMDHYVARGGPQEFFPLTPKGGRYVEVHVLAPEQAVRFIREEFVERCYFDRPEGRFAADEPWMEKTWHIGLETIRACSEDALIDNPTRERGQWLGDIATVGIENVAVGWSDMRLVRRGLVQSAQCAREDGLVAAQGPGQLIYTPTYAAQWFTACLRYHELTGDRSLLVELFDAACRNQEALDANHDEQGLHERDELIFVDWGVARNSGPVCLALNLLYLEGLRRMRQWCGLVNERSRAVVYDQCAARVEASLNRLLRGLDEPIEFHALVLALRLDLVDEAGSRQAIDRILAHVHNCFPINREAPRLGSPYEAQPQLVTPYFMHFTLPELIERGHMDDALDIMRRCWGWAMEQERTTWVEVFDTRWSHCHQWAGCPTWMLSRYLLGLRPRQDLGADTLALVLQTGSVGGARGRLPLAGGGHVDVEWTRPDGADVQWRAEATRPLSIANHENRVVAHLDGPVCWRFGPGGEPVDAPEGLCINHRRAPLGGPILNLFGSGQESR